MTALPGSSDQAGRQDWTAILRSPGLFGLNLASRCVYLVLWEWAGCREGSLSVSVAGIANTLRLRERNVRNNLYRLAAAEAIEIRKWHRDGTMELSIKSPATCDQLRLRKPSPQGELFDDPPAPEGTEPPATVPIDAEERKLAELERRKKRQAAAEQKPATEIPFDVAAAEALQDAVRQLTDTGDPAEQKGRLIAKIKQVVQDPDMNDSLPGKVVDLVIDGKTRWSDVQKILSGIRAIREAKADGRGPGFTTSSGAYFVKSAQRLHGWTD